MFALNILITVILLSSVTLQENASKISPGYTHIVEDEILTQPKGNIKSQLRLRVNTTQSRNINFSIQTKESILCGKDINITFVGRFLSISCKNLKCITNVNIGY